jgi:hypothetical protein
MVEVPDAAALVAATVEVARVGTVVPEVEAAVDVSAERKRSQWCRYGGA